MAMTVCVPCWMTSLSAMALYLCGSVPFGYLVARAQGVDIQEKGSGNIGATNVARVLGKKWGYMVFALDFLKSFLPLCALALMMNRMEWDHNAGTLYAIAGLAAILGHNYTPWLEFKGGKGIATTAGVLAAIMPWCLGVVVLVFALLVGLTRTVSLGSVGAGVALPVAAYFLYPTQGAYLIFALIAGFLSVWRHRTNLQRVGAGTEPKIGEKKSE